MNDAEFERQLRASLRFGAEQVRIPEVGFDPLTLDGRSRTRSEPGCAPARPSRCRTGHRTSPAAGTAVVRGGWSRGWRPPPWPAWSHWRWAWRVRPGREPLVGPGRWRSVGLADQRRNGPVVLLHQVSSTEFTAPAHSRVTLSITIAPQHPDGKTYLYRSIDTGVWELLGPHNTDATSRELLRVPTPAAGQVAAYRLYVAGTTTTGAPIRTRSTCAAPRPDPPRHLIAGTWPGGRG